MRKRLVIPAVALAAIAAGAALLLSSSAGRREPTVDNQAPAAADARPAYAPRPVALPERATLSGSGDMFPSQSWVAPAAAPVARAAPPPAVPPMPFRVAGVVVREGQGQVVLAKGDTVLTVTEGETLDEGYRVESIDADQIILLYLPLGVRQSLPLVSTLGVPVPPSAGRAAQLRWEGPESVRAGSNFSLTLRVTSEQPLRASPLQVSFDAKVLEPIAVRPGKLFGGEGRFSYRVNPDGLIVVGASGPDSVAKDTELVVLTFKPIRAGTAAEVKLSSLSLEGPVGKPIAVEQPAAYRTAITP